MHISDKRHNRRKLVPRETVVKIVEGVEQGVPLSKLLRTHKISTSRTHVIQLMHWYNTAIKFNDSIILDSLFPAWLSADNSSCPHGFIYIGTFPYGKWGREGADA